MNFLKLSKYSDLENLVRTELDFIVEQCIATQTRIQPTIPTVKTFN